MNINIENIDLIIDHTAPFLSFIKNGTSASTYRLIKVDIQGFVSWLAANRSFLSDTNESTVTSNFKESIYRMHRPEVVTRKLRSISKYYDWLRDLESSDPNKTDVSQIISPSFLHFESKSQQSKTTFLLVLLSICLVCGVYFLFSISSKPHIPITRVPPFLLDIPVISKISPQSLKNSLFQISIFSSDTSKNRLAKLICRGLAANSSTGSSIKIDVTRYCTISEAVDDLAFSPDKGIFIDITVGTTQINDKRVPVFPIHTQKGEYALTESQDSSTFSISKPLDTLPISGTLAREPFASNSANIIPKPSNQTSIPLETLQIFDISSGDVAMISNKTITRAILNSPVVGVLSEDSLVIRGQANVNISPDSEDIKIGDYISTGILPGKALKASLGFENIIGVALADWSNNSDKLNILLLDR